MTGIDIGAALEKPLGRFRRLSAEERLVGAVALVDALNAASAEVAEARRAAVRELKLAGYTYQEIGDMAGLTPTRIYQIEVGWQRQERKARKSPP